MESTKKDTKKYTIFNKEWEVIENLGSGTTARVYLARHIKDHNKKVAIKLIRQEFLSKKEEGIKSIEQEISILHGLEHQNIIKISGYGSDGRVDKPSGKVLTELVYIMIEYVPGGIFFDLCKSVGGMGEKIGRYFMEQLVDVLVYLSKKKVAHRDLKLENILVDDDLNLKVADFGFATYKHCSKLRSYRGTKTYMAPEIKESKTYDGRQVDMFSVGVILFIMVLGIFPFSEAVKGEYYYQMLVDGKYKKYWKKTGGEALSDDFKDLIIKMLSYEPDKRPSIEELKNHPWMKMTDDEERIKVKKELQQMLKDNKYELTTQDTESTKVESQKSL